MSRTSARRSASSAAAASRVPQRRPLSTTAQQASGPSTRYRRRDPTRTANYRHLPGKRPRKVGRRVLLEIRYYQCQPGLLLNKLPFTRVVREIMHAYKTDLRIQAAALTCLQEAAETYLVAWFECLQSSACHGRRVTIMQKDASHICNLARQLIGHIVSLVNVSQKNVGSEPILKI